MRKPQANELATGLQAYVTAMERKRKKEQEAAEALAKKLLEEEDRKRKEAEKLALVNQRINERKLRKQQLDQLRQAHLASIHEKVVGPSSSFNSRQGIKVKIWGAGKQTRKEFHTHTSKCHGSRETVDALLCDHSSRHNNGNFLQKMPTNGLPMELVYLEPFAEPRLPSTAPRRLEPIMGVKKYFGIDHSGWLADELDSVLPKKELEYIRNGGSQRAPFAGFTTRLKYYIP